jgi:hypothetical protein
MGFLFLKQGKTGLDANLCGFFALYHFTNGRVTRDQYLDKAKEMYKAPPLCLPEEEAAEMAQGGNDPAVYKAFGLTKGTQDAVAKFEVVIVCDVKCPKGHFFTIRKENGEWWNYDSYNYDQPTKIGNDEAAKGVCGGFDVYFGSVNI